MNGKHVIFSRLLQSVYQTLSPEELVFFKKKIGHEKLLEILETLEAEEADLKVQKIRMDPVKIPDRDISKL